MLSAHIHNLQPAVGPDFSLHPVQMVLHRLLGQRKMIRNLFVRQTARKQRNQLLLAACQPQVAAQRSRGKRLRFLFEIPE